MKTTHAPVLARWLFLVAGCALLGCSGGGGRAPDASTAGAAGRARRARAGWRGRNRHDRRQRRARSVAAPVATPALAAAWAAAARAVARRCRGHGRCGRGGRWIRWRRRSVAARARSAAAAAAKADCQAAAAAAAPAAAAERPAPAEARPATCPSGSFTTPNSSTITLTKVAGVPPFDAFNNNGNNFGNIEGNVLVACSTSPWRTTPPARILRVPTTGAVSIAHATSGSNGLAIDVMGRLIGASHTAGGVLAFNLTNMTSTPIVSTYGSPAARFNTPNDPPSAATGRSTSPIPTSRRPAPPAGDDARLLAGAGSTTAMVVDAGDRT